jgi:hypothetical protein
MFRAAVGLALLVKANVAISKERPVMKIVRMLQDMQTELQKELEDDKAVHDMLGCWCKTNEQEKNTGNRNGFS